MTTYYKATFSDGTVLKRGTASRTYTHAYRTALSYTVDGRASGYRCDGFSSSERLARKAGGITAGGWVQQQPNFKVLMQEVVPVVEIDAKEYRRRDK